MIVAEVIGALLALSFGCVLGMMLARLNGRLG